MPLLTVGQTRAREATRQLPLSPQKAQPYNTCTRARVTRSSQKHICSHKTEPKATWSQELTSSDTAHTRGHSRESFVPSCLNAASRPTGGGAWVKAHVRLMRAIKACWPTRGSDKVKCQSSGFHGGERQCLGLKRADAMCVHWSQLRPN